MPEARRFPQARRFTQGGVATPHYLASATGLAVLADGGNAVDAAVAANLTLGVVAPYFCGYGGDLFAIVWDGRLHGYLGSGRSPAGISLDAVAAESPTMPVLGAHTVTVPGAPAGWFALLERWGTRSFGELAARARRYALEGFEVTAPAGEIFEGCRHLYADFPPWLAVYGGVATGAVLRQPALARTIDRLAAEGPAGYYGGPVAEAISAAVHAAGGTLAPTDLGSHVGSFVAPLRAPYRDVEIAELPPPTQGVTALEALRIVDGAPLPPAGAQREHLLVEAMTLALADREQYVTDPAVMELSPAELLADEWVEARRDLLDPERARATVHGAGTPGGTAYLCAADGDGVLVSLIQSNFLAFGSGVHVPEWGINLNNRGSSFTLDPTRANALAPSKFPMHTLIPAMALRDGEPWLVFGSMGGDAQAQVHLQLMAHLVDDGADAQPAIDAPRWRVEPAAGQLMIERRFPGTVLDDLRTRGHAVNETRALDSGMGHAHAILRTRGGYAIATDPRAEGAALGL
ncbi:MAG TPA: gamma-glutamyltransferase family protein [Acidimicrobiia bacterium]